MTPRIPHSKTQQLPCDNDMQSTCALYIGFATSPPPIPQLLKLLQRIFQIRIFESEICLNTGTPTCFIVEVHIRSLFVFVRGYLWFLVALEPSHVFFVKPPALLLQLPSGKILLICALCVIEDEE